MYMCVNSTLIIPHALLDDLIPDCPNNDDEMQHANTENTQAQCPPEMYECLPGSSLCFSEGHRCLYNLTRDTFTLMYCRNGKHLQDCESHPCQPSFKCQQSYCIPNRYICNGKWDCWTGEEEMSCTNISCKALFKCKLASTCIPKRNVCDGVVDCPQQDDEKFCGPISCLAQCLCLNYGISCIKVFLSAQQLILILPDFVFIHISSSQLPEIKASSIKFTIILELLNNNKTSFCICENRDIKVSIRKADVRHNFLSTLEKACLCCLAELRQLNLQNNSISFIEEFTFDQVPSLSFLDLSYNEISVLEKHSLSGMKNLQILNVAGNDILFFSMSLVSEMKPQLVLADDFHICCLGSSSFTVCTARPVWPHLCTNLLPTVALKVMTWCWTVLIIPLCFLCACTIAVQWYRQKTINDYNMYIILLNVCDFVLGLYLLSICIMDISHTTNFMEKDKVWRGSLPCHLLAFCFLLALFLECLFMTIISIARFKVVADPFEKPFSRRQNMFLTSIFVSIFICFIVVCMLIRNLVEGKSSLSLPFCLLLGSTDDSVVQVLITIVVSAYLCLMLATSEIFYLKLICFDSQSPVIDEKREKKRKRGIITNALLSGITNACSWLPASLFYFVTVFLGEFSVHALYWISLIVLPLNALMNPLIYRLSDVKDFLSRRCCTRERTKEQNVAINAEANLWSTTASQLQSCTGPWALLVVQNYEGKNETGKRTSDASSVTQCYRSVQENVCWQRLLFPFVQATKNVAKTRENIYA